jgi:hypothetical protein
MLRVEAGRLPIDGQGGRWAEGPAHWILVGSLREAVLFGTVSAFVAWLSCCTDEDGWQMPEARQSADVPRLSAAAKRCLGVWPCACHVPGFRRCDQHIHAG